MLCTARNHGTTHLGDQVGEMVRFYDDCGVSKAVQPKL